MKTTEQVKALSLEELIIICNEVLADPYSGYFPYIEENDPDFLDRIAENNGGAWLVEAVLNGHYDPKDKYIICLEDGTEVLTFSDKEGLFSRLIKPEDFAEQYNLSCGE